MQLRFDSGIFRPELVACPVAMVWSLPHVAIPSYIEHSICTGELPMFWVVLCTNGEY